MNTSESQQAKGTINSAQKSETQSVNTTNSQKPAIPARRRIPLRGTAIAFLLALSAFLGLRGYQDSSSVDLPQAQAASASIPAPALDTIPIEQIRVGQRVLTDGAPPDQTLPTAVDEHTWRHLTFEQTDTWPNNTIDCICVESLMPPAWLAFHDGAPVGSTVPIPLDLEEMGLPEGMTANVVANNPCPPIDQGPGRVVLTTVNHLNPQVVELTLTDVGCVSTHQSPQEDALAAQETVRPTAHHKFYSETRAQWLSAEDLQPGKHLRGLTGPLQVVSQRPIPGTHRVYNMTVEGEHVYHVSTLGVLAHNNRCNFVPIEDLQVSAARLKAPTRVPDNPYFTRVDPNLPGRPDPRFSIDSKTFSAGKITSNGGIRNTKEFWQQWQNLQPGSLSKSNRYLIENYNKLKVSPRIDDDWIKVFPEHAPFKGDLIIHHHVDFGRYTIPVPGRTHVGSGGVWHTK